MNAHSGGSAANASERLIPGGHEQVDHSGPRLRDHHPYGEAVIGGQAVGVRGAFLSTVKSGQLDG